MRRALLLGSILIVAAAGRAALASPAAAPAAPPAARLGDSLSGAAKDDYESGRVLFENHDYSGALVKFQHAFELSSDVRLLWNMGACEKNLHHYARVLTLVERFLREGGSRLTPAQRDEAETVVRTVRPLVGEIHVFVDEGGATVAVDDVTVGTTPLSEPLLVDLGDRRIRVSKPGFEEHVSVEHVTGASMTTISVALARERHEGRLTVATDAAAAIDLDGKIMGVGRWQGTVMPGSHALRITADGMQPYQAELAIRDGESRSVDITLRKQSSGVSPWLIGGIAVAAAGLGVGGYFLFRPSTTTAAPTDGTIAPYKVTVQAPH